MLAVLALLVGLFPPVSVRASSPTLISVGCTEGVGDTAALLDAFAVANADGGPQTIELAPDCAYFLHSPATTGSDGPTGLPTVLPPSSLTIRGNGSTILRAPGAPPFRLLAVAPSASLILEHLTLANGDAGAGDGGAILNRGSVILDRVTIRDSAAARGGGLASFLTAAIDRSLLLNNNANEGGAVYHAAGSLNITVRSSTISQNRANDAGGGFFSAAALDLRNVTVAENSAASGGGVAMSHPTFFARNTIIAYNSAASGVNCWGTPTTLAPNLQWPGTSCGSKFTSADPLLTPLADNTGPTLTYGLHSGSPAINTAHAGSCVPYDQRGFARPVDGGCDIGALEQGKIFVVSKTGNSGGGSLRSAISSANSHANLGPPDVIYFRLSGTGPFVINPTAALPAISEAVIIDGWSQPGFAGTPQIELRGGSMGARADCLRLSGGASVVRGLAIGGCGGSGLLIDGPATAIVQGMHLGLDPAGTTARPNAAGLSVKNGAQGVRVGGLRAVEANLIAGNSGPGLRIIEGDGAKVIGNSIGVSRDGSALPNAGPGLQLGGGELPAQDNLLGGPLSGAGNLIGGNGGPGILLKDGAVGSRVYANQIGLRADLTALPNDGHGLLIDGASDSRIGGVAALANTIAANTGAGVAIVAGAGNSVRYNRLTGNGGLGIDLGPAGVTPNDPLDADDGPNALLNAPALDEVIEGSGGLAVLGSLQSAPHQSFSIDFYASAECDASGSGEGATYLGTSVATTDAAGQASFTFDAASLILAERWITATATDAAGNTSEFSACAPILTNDVWVRAEPIELSDPDGAGLLSGSAGQTIAFTTQERWYRFPATSGARVSITLTGAPGSVLSLHRNLPTVYAQLGNPQSAEAQQAGTLPGTFLPGTFLPGTFLPGTFLPGTFLPGTFLPGTFLPGTFLPGTFLPGTFLPGTFLPGTFLPGTFLPGTFLPGTFLPGTFLPERYSGAIGSSLIAVAYDPSSEELTIERNSWDLAEDLYVRVAGPPGPFELNIDVRSGVCAAVAPPPAELEALVGALPGGPDRATAIIWDSQRFAASDSPAGADEVAAALARFAERNEIDGAVIDLAANEGAGPKYPRVAAARATALANPTCSVAQNLLAYEIKALVDLLRAANPAVGADPGLEYVVLVGGDDVVPSGRYPDLAGLASEAEYFPPVAEDSPSNASLREGRVLSDNLYGASVSVWRGSYELPIPDLAVGRLPGSSAEVLAMLAAYSAEPVVRPSSALVTGYDFVADGALAVSAEIGAGLGTAPTELIQPEGEGRDGRNAWSADDLRPLLLEQRNDLVFFTGHFDAGGLLAADYRTGLLASEIASAPADFTNTILFGLGCHSGYNIPRPDGIAGFSPEPDWAEAYAARGATYVAATGYAYGDTELIEYGERFLVELTRAMRAGTGPVPIGKALNAARRAYLADLPSLSGMHEKTLLEFTLNGLPMLSVDMPAGRNQADEPPALGGASPVSGGPGAAYGLATSAELTVNPTLSEQQKNLTNLEGGPDIVATYLSGGDGTVTGPGEPILPLELRNVGLAGLSLRGAGFRGGSYSDTTGVIPLVSAATTEESRGHAAFYSPTFYPAQPWTVNTSGELAGDYPRLAAIAAQVQSEDPLTGAGTLRRYSAMRFKLYYLPEGWSDSADADLRAAAVAAPPQIQLVEIEPSGGGYELRVYIASDARAGVQEAWITWTDPDAPGLWQSIDLAPVVDTPGLWRATASLPASALFMVQAVNGAGKVTVDTNNGALYAMTPPLPAPAAVPTLLEAMPGNPTSGAYGETIALEVRLRRADGAPLEGRRVRLLLGGQIALADTDASGVARLTMNLGQIPGDYQARLSYAGEAGLAPARIAFDFSVTKAATTLTIAPAGPLSVQQGQSAGLVATLRDAAGRGIPDRTIIFVAAGGPQPLAVAAKTGGSGQAVLGPITWPGGSYQVTAYFATPIGGVALSDLYYQGASSSSVDLTVEAGAPPVTAASVSGTTNPACPADCFVGSATITLSVDQPDAVTRYSLNGGPEQIYSGPFSVSAPGANLIEFFSVSAGGIAEAPQTLTVKIVESPVTPVLDDFTHPDSPQLVGSWFGKARKDYRIVNNQVDVGYGGDVLWNGPSNGFGADQEAHMRLTTIDPNSRHHTLMLKVQKRDWQQGAILVAYNAVDKTVDIEVLKPGVGWKLIGSFPATMVNGDLLSARALPDGTVRAYVNCELVGTADTRASHAGNFYVGRGGHIGVWFMDADGATFDDFGGGEP